MKKIQKSCDNCIHLSSYKMCSPYCINGSSHEFNCDYCAYKFPKENPLFCESDNGDDGMSCCGDNFKLNPNFILYTKIMKKTEKIPYIDYECQVGERVQWRNVLDEHFEGVILSWNDDDILTASVMLDTGSVVEIAC